MGVRGGQYYLEISSMGSGFWGVCFVCVNQAETTPEFIETQDELIK